MMRWVPAVVFAGALAVSACAGIMAVDWLMRRSYEKRQADERG